MTWHAIWDFITKLVHPESIIHYGGLALLTAVIFSETGLLIGFFLPGDSLLFTAGLLSATGVFSSPIEVVLPCLMAATIAGDSLGYLIGRKGGPKVFNRKESWLFKKEYVTMTREFYDKHGGKTLVLGRFIPIIRTFAPVMAGVAGLPYRRFILFSMLGGIAWVGSITSIGYILGQQIPWIKDYLEYIIIGLVVITTIPILLKLRSEARKRSKSRATPVTNGNK